MTESPASLFSSFRYFGADFVAFAGASGVTTLFLVFCGAVLEGAGLVLLLPLLAVATNQAVHDGGWLGLAAYWLGLAGAHSQLAKLAVLLAALGAVMALRAIVLMARDLRLAKLQVGFVEYQRSKVVDRLASSSWEDVSRLRHARIAHLMSGDIQRIGSAANSLLRSATSLVLLLSQCALAFWLSPLLASAVFAILTACGLGSYAVLRRARRFGMYATTANLELIDTTMQFLGGLKLAISHNAQFSFARRFQNTLRKLAREQISFSKQVALTNIAGTTIAFSVGATGLLVGLGLLHLEPVVLATLLLVVGRMSAPALQIQQGIQQIASLLPAYEKLRDLISELKPAQGVEIATVGRIAAGTILFSGVSYRHPAEGKEIRGRGVHGLSLQIPKACLLGVAGPSGSGKTTFADLLAGLYLPQCGTITQGGQTISAPELPAWRQRTSYVPQDAFLFHDGIRENLAWAVPEATEDDMWQALIHAEAGEMVSHMPYGLDTIMGERGNLISGGERQRIALARAILRRPDLLILDEATSGVDLAMERKILRRLRTLSPSPTIVLISHRPESLAYCDAILCFADGRAFLQEALKPTITADADAEMAQQPA